VCCKLCCNTGNSHVVQVLLLLVCCNLCCTTRSSGMLQVLLKDKKSKSVSKHRFFCFWISSQLNKSDTNFGLKVALRKMPFESYDSGHFLASAEKTGLIASVPWVWIVWVRLFVHIFIHIYIHICIYIYIYIYIYI